MRECLALRGRFLVLVCLHCVSGARRAGTAEAVPNAFGEEPAQEAKFEALPAGTNVMEATSLEAFGRRGVADGYGEIAVAPIQGMPFDQAFRARNTETPPHTYFFRVSTSSAIPMESDDYVLGMFYARTVEPPERGAR